MANARDIILNLLGKETISPAAKKAGAALDDLGDDAESTARKARKLDKDADELTKSLAGLAAAWVSAGSAAEKADIAKAIKVDKAKLRETMNMRKLMGDVGGESASGFVTGFVARLGPLVVSKMPMAMNPAVAAIGAGPALTIATTLGTAVAGGIVGAAGVGGVVGGLAIAAKHSAVKAAATSMSEEVGGILQRAAVSFVPAAVEGLSIIRGEFRQAEGDLSTLFSASSRYVRPLAEGVGSAFRDILAGVAELASRAGPVINVISSGIKRFGDAARDGLESLGDNANEGARALAIMFTVLEYGVRAIFATVNGFAEMFGWMEKVGGLMTGQGFTAVIRDAYEDQMKAADGSATLSKELEGLLAGFQGTSTEAQAAAVSTAATAAALQSAGVYANRATGEVENYAEVLGRVTSKNLSAEQATLQMEEAIDAATAASRQNNDGIDKNTEKGRANRQMLITLASASISAAQAIYEQTGSADAAAAAAERGKKKFIEAAVAMGVERTEAIRLANQLFAIPSPNPKVTLDTAQARAQAKAIQEVISGIRGKNVVVGVYYTSSGDLKLPGGTQMKERGGPVRKGQAYVVGEKRAEVFVPDRDGTIIPSIERFDRMTGRAGGGSGGAIHLHVNFSGPVGSQMELRDWLVRSIDELKRRGRF